MTLELLGQLNWLAIIVAALVYFALGALWYSPVAFGRQWQRSMGWDETKQQPGMNAMTYVAPAAFALVSATATAWLASATGADDFADGITLGLIVGVGYALTLTAYEAVFDPNKPAPWVWWAITGSYHTVGLIIASVIVSVWK